MSLLLLLLVSGCTSVFQENSNSLDYLEILNANSEAKEYLSNHPNADIESIELLNQSQINYNKKNSRFQALYENVSQNRVVKVTIKGNSSLKLVSLIDEKTNQVISVVGIYVAEVSS